MAITRVAPLVVLGALLWPSPLLAQAPVAELSMTGGASTEDVGAAATQLSIFGEVTSDLRFYVEGAWGQRWGTATDTFGAAYPYE